MKAQAVFPSAFRAILQSIALLPATLALASYAEVSPASWMAIFLVSALSGTLLSAGTRFRPWHFYLLLFAAAIGVVAVSGFPDGLPALYAGLMVWLGWRRFRFTIISLTGFAANGVFLIAAFWAQELEPYKTLFILSGVIWLIIAAYVGHAAQLDAAGLHNGIVTRLVLRSSRRYLAILLVAVLAVYAATSDFHLWRSIVAFLKEHMPKSSPAEPEPSALPNSPSGMFPPGEPASPAKWGRWLDYALYALAGAVGLAVLWFLSKRFLLNREWARELASKLRGVLRRLLQRREQPAAPAYVDEKESLLDIGKTLRRAQSRWLSRSANKPLNRTDWEKLENREKVRRLYKEAILQAIRAGYKPNPADTPTEALVSVARWYDSSSSGRDFAGMGGWLRKARDLLADQYGKARYGADEATPGELERLAGEYPWKSRKG